MINCPVCGSHSINHLETIMENEIEGYEEYACEDCYGHFQFGIKIIQFKYTGKNNIFPFEQERDR